MKNLAYSLNSVETSYGDSVLTSVIQIYERINDVDEYLSSQTPFTEIKKREMEDRLDKLSGLNRKIQHELEIQIQKLNSIKLNLAG
jgi:DNA repair ATPase RecN